MIDLALKGTYIARARCNDLFLYKKEPFNIITYLEIIGEC